MELKQALEAAVVRLETAAVGSPRMNAEVLLMFTLACDRAYLYAHSERTLTEDEVSRYDEVLSERARGVPSQYIIGHQEFWGLDLVVTPAVLIPRPETEHVVETVLELASEMAPQRVLNRPQPGMLRAKSPTVVHWPKIVDVGTGSGCIALALANEMPQADIIAVDVSADALEVARANAARLQLSERVRFCQGDLLRSFTQESTFDFIVSNPPYVSEGEADKVQREVRKFEPHIAVFGGPEGLDTVRRLVEQARPHLSDGGWLVMEIGFSQEQQVRDLLAGWAEVRSVLDLQSIPRVIAARR
jgi:release factor glutamine methyltransferase